MKILEVAILKEFQKIQNKNIDTSKQIVKECKQVTNKTNEC